MSRPLFAVGEECLLQSVSSPELNGPVTVLKVLEKGELWECRLTGTVLRAVDYDADGKVGNIYSYVLEECTPTNARGIEVAWAESALRKKYPPSDMSFEQLMSSLKVKEKA